ncbi:MAG TPA: GDSL-type esterase/lipase family protein [Bryobacteraceae bacterium]|nr:GDSL-type esterase/lipase family protein [Bryobacteraceae bacterium]
MRTFPVHTALTLALLCAALAGARLATPRLKAPDAALFGEIVDFSPEKAPATPWQPKSEPLPPPAAKPSPHSALLNDANGALDSFYEALWRTERREPGAVTHIVHYGDSPTTADLITGDVRAILQKRFGDAGHGFVLPAKPWAWYQHSGVTVSGSGWQMLPASHFEAHDGLFGLGGVSFTGQTGASSRLAFQEPGQTDFEIWFLRQPGGGAFTAEADGAPLGRVETAADQKTPGFAAFHLDAPARVLQLRVEEPNVRLFGVAASKPGTGVVYDSLGLNGASITVLSRMFNRQHWAEELSHRNPQLVIVNYGTNEADFDKFIVHGYEAELRAAIARIRAAVPHASLLVMSPMDRGYLSGPGEISTMPTIPRIVAIQRRVAADTGCGFFDTYAAMGGEGTMARWYAAQPRLVSADFIHPTPQGGRIVATVFTHEIETGLDRYKVAHLASPQTSAAGSPPRPAAGAAK